MRVVGLLRGVNVGKSVQVPMKELQRLLDEAGLANILTYLNSGNVVFDSDVPIAELGPRLDATIQARFGVAIPLLLLEGPRIQAIRDAIPAHWENDETQQTYVAYLFPDADRRSLIDELPVKREWIDLRYVPGAVLWNIQRADYNRSQITKIAGHKAYARMTTRNVNTARKLAELCGGAP